MTRQMSKGKCHLCSGTFSKAAMTGHLKSCKREKAVSNESRPARKPRKTKTFHLIVQGRYLPDYWMHVEVPAHATLETLDGFLRRTWLECCGHMSAFTIEDKTYSIAPMSEYDDASMDVRLDEILTPGMKFYHKYDFGTTTHLSLKVVSQDEGDIKAKEMQVLARNDPPVIPCTSCGKPAAQVCTECLWSGQGWLCNDCAAKHECDKDMLLPVVNSPRVGMCGYTGD